MIPLLAFLLCAQEPPDLRAALERKILDADTPMREIADWIDNRVPMMPELKTADEARQWAEDTRKEVFEKVLFRGEAARWRDAATRVEWLDTIEGGPGYTIRKVRYEALPGLWIPALLYVPDKTEGKVPVHLAVNGHDGKGKAADYKQIRCINLAKRGVISLNVEWFAMGQLRTPGYGHYRMNQLDLCGTSGLAPFYLSMKRGLDLLLELEHADPARVAVSGLSGGGWQTIFISALDRRVTLANPVAGYSSFATRVRHLKDLGDSEQTPSDLATVADYTHLTAMRAPRPTLLTFCAKDNCCFEAGYALPPLRDAAAPHFAFHGKESYLRSHVNEDPGTHNYLLDNRQQFYRMVGDFFFPGSASYDAREIPSDKEVKTAEQLQVELPRDNADFNSLARALAAGLPRDPALPADKAAARARLKSLIRAKDWTVRAERDASTTLPGIVVTHLRLRIDGFTVPAVRFTPPEAKETVLLFAETGRESCRAWTQRFLAEGKRVLVFDPFFWGESKIKSHDFLFAMTAAAVGERPLGIQVSQVAAIARWAKEESKTPVVAVAGGPRSSLVALCAAAIEDSIGGLRLYAPYASLKEIVEQNLGVNERPELFCFGLLEAFDVRQIASLVAPRPIGLVWESGRARTELEPFTSR
jgi:hypothetical protein